MTPEEIEIVAKAIHRASRSGVTLSESEAEAYARLAITALDQYREGKAEASLAITDTGPFGAPAWALKAMPGLSGIPEPHAGPFGVAPTKKEDN